MLQSVWFEVTGSDGDGVCTVKSRSVEEDAPVCRWKYWPYWFGVVGDRDEVCIAGSCPAVRDTILVWTASGWTLVMFKRWGFIILAYTNNGLFPPTCEEVWNGWLYTGRGWVEKLLGFRCLVFVINWRTPIWNSKVSSSLKFWKDGIMPLKNNRYRFGWFSSSITFIILSSNSSGLRFRFPHCCVRGFRVVSWEKLFISSLPCSPVVTCDPSILSTDKLSAACLSLISFDRNLSWLLYTYFPAFEDLASDFVASFFIWPYIAVSDISPSFYYFFTQKSKII